MGLSVVDVGDGGDDGCGSGVEVAGVPSGSGGGRDHDEERRVEAGWLVVAARLMAG
jgi:hypothetical protein